MMDVVILYTVLFHFILIVPHCHTLFVLDQLTGQRSAITDIEQLLQNLTIYDDIITNCQISIIYGNFQNDLPYRSRKTVSIFDSYFEKLSQSEVLAQSSGISLTIPDQQAFSNRSLLPSLVPRRVTPNTSMCTSVFLILPVQTVNTRHEEYLYNLMFTPLLNPPHIANQDKFIVISRVEALSDTYHSRLLKRIKYKLIVAHQANTIQTYQFCYYCPSGNKHILPVFFATDESTSTSSIFPDFETNYFGGSLRVSSTDKLPGVFDIVTLPNGKNVVKRGYHALALFHVMEGLNLTYDLYRSGARGSTGHKLANGTWVGTVGEVFNDQVDIGMACSMTFGRHFLVELMAPISFEYVNFAVGPPVKIYSWKSLFWPFDGLLWTAIIISTAAVVCTSYFLLKLSVVTTDDQCYNHYSKWTTATVIKYLGMVWIEQSEEIPQSLPQPIKIVLGYWLLFCVVGTNICRAKMVTFMTFPLTHPVPVTFDNLAGSEYDIVFHYFGSVAFNTFKESHSPAYAAILGRMVKEPSPMKCLLSTVTSTGESSGKACILFGASYRELIHKNLSDAFGQSPISRNPNTGFMFTPGIISKKNAVFSQNFHSILSRSLQMGLHDYWEKADLNRYLKAKNDWLRHTNQRQLDYGQVVRIRGKDDDESNVHLRHLKGAISLLVTGLSTGSVVFLGEILWRRVDQIQQRNYTHDKYESVAVESPFEKLIGLLLEVACVLFFPLRNMKLELNNCFGKMHESNNIDTL